MTEKQKPLLFIDVDGVLIYLNTENDGPKFEVRPNVNEFLLWCIENFTCYWLTCWGDPTRTDRIKFDTRIIGKIKECKWRQYNRNKALGALSTAKGRKFYWIEDKLPEKEIGLLKVLGLEDCYIEVSYYGENELDRVKVELERRLGKEART